MPTEDMMLGMLQVYDPHAIYPCLDTVYSKNYSNTNFAAGGQDVHVVRAIVSEREEQTNLVDAIIERAETILVQLREKREQLVSSKKVHTIFLSCIRRLPSEVLGEIFLQCVPLGEYVRPVKEDVPLLLTQICRRWREIALDTPRLWCSLSATPRTRMIPGAWDGLLSRKWRQTPASKWEPYLPFYDDWLKRAKCCPLSLNLDISKPSDAPNLPDTTPPRVEIKAAIDLFKPYTSRSRELTLSVDETDCLSLLLQDVPILEYLFVKGNLSNPPTLSIVQPQPRLRTLIISSPGFGDTTVTDVLSTFNPGWMNLTHLTMMLDSSQGNTFLKLIQTCPNLERLFFSPANVPPHANPVSLTHSNLRVLELRNLDLNNAPTDTLTLPNLCSLQVDSGVSAFRSASLPEQLPPHRSRHRTFNLTIRFSDQNFFTFFNPDLSSITHLRLRIGTSGILLQVIQLCLNLEEADISIDGHDYWRPPTPSFTHYQLRSLTLRDLTAPLNGILDTFTLPSLRNLEITHLGKQRWPHAEFKKFFSRSRFLLERLTIEGMMMYNVDKSNFTTLIPTLEHVKIRKYVRSNSDYGTHLRYWLG